MKNWLWPDGFIGDDPTSKRNALWLGCIAWVVLLVLLSGCASVPQVTDSYCNLYVPVITDKGDGNITASIAVKRKLLANELTHRKLCP